MRGILINTKIYMYLSLIALSCLTACMSKNPIQAQLTEQSSVSKAATPYRAPSSLSAFHITGAIAAKKNKKAWSAALNWSQFNQKNYNIHLFGPLGGGSVNISKQEGLVTYRDGNHSATSTNENGLLYKETGTDFPVHELFYWVKGMKAPGHAHFAQYDANGKLIALQQAGYSLHYSNYITVQGYTLPTKIHLENKNGFVKLVIKNWGIND